MEQQTDSLSFFDWTDNRREYEYGENEDPCLLCWKPVKWGRGVEVGLDETNSIIVKPSESTSFYKIGPECYRKHKAELDPFIVKR